MSSQHPAKVISRNRTRTLRLLAVFLTLLAIIVLGETGARLFYRDNFLPQPPPPQEINPYGPNPYVVNLRPYLFVHLPGARYTQKIFSHRNEYRINSRGFRGPEIRPQPPPGTKRLLIIGDSVVEGHGVLSNETFAHYLGEFLAGHHWEVVNLGTQGGSPLYYAANLERYLALQPDAVLLLVHENDLHDDELREQSYFTLPYLSDRAGLYSGGRAHSLAATSRLIGLLQHAWHNVHRSPLEERIAANSMEPTIHAADESSQQKSSFAVPLEKYDRRWAMSSSYLTTMLDELRSRNIKVLLAPLCTITLAFPSNPSYSAQCANLDGHARQWAKEHTVPFLSLVPTMHQAFAEHRMDEVLILNDFHPTPMTHRKLAQSLYPFVTANLAGPPLPGGTDSGTAQ